MSQPAHRPARHEDLFAVPAHMVGEIIGGALLMSPRRRARHARVTSRLGADLDALFDGPSRTDGPGGWILLDEPELHLGSFTGAARARDEVLVPDLAGWRRERMPRVPDVAAFELPPDWVCEVLSPSTERTDRVSKMPVYAAAGVRWVWLIAPEQRLLEVYRLSGDIYARVGAHAGALPPDEQRHPAEAGLRKDRFVVAEPFDAAELDMNRWWIEEGPDEAP